MHQSFKFNLADTTDEEIVKQRLKKMLTDKKSTALREICAIVHQKQPISRRNVSSILGRDYGEILHENSVNARLRQLELGNIICSKTYSESVSVKDEKHEKIKNDHKQDYGAIGMQSQRVKSTKYFSMTERGDSIMPFILEKMKEVVENEKKNQQSQDRGNSGRVF